MALLNVTEVYNFTIFIRNIITVTDYYQNDTIIG